MKWVLLVLALLHIIRTTRSTCTQTPEVLLWQISIASWANTATTLCDHSIFFSLSPLHSVFDPALIPGMSASPAQPIPVTNCSFSRDADTTALQSPCPCQHHYHTWSKLFLLFHTPGLKILNQLPCFLFFFSPLLWFFFAAGFSSWTDTRGRLSSCFSLRRYLAAPLPPVSDEGMV